MPGGPSRDLLRGLKVILPLAMLLRVVGMPKSRGQLLAAFAVLVLGCVVFAIALVRATLRFCETKPYQVVRTGVVEQEVLPPSDGMFHVLLFKWRLFGDGWLYQNALRKLNSEYLHWDTPFTTLGQDAEAEVLGYCDRYGIPKKPWAWSKPAAEYETMNEWFGRHYAPALAPEARRGDAVVLAPATGVVSWYPAVSEMPRLLKNDRFSIAECGIPAHGAYEAHPCAVVYLAPADYHCFHAPISGTISHVEMLGMRTHSASVKTYIFEHTNILAVNRRAVLVIEADGVPATAPAPRALRCAFVAVGGVTVDSIRLEAHVVPGARVERGARLGCFARGGSSVALFFSQPVALDGACAAVHALGLPFKLDCAASLADPLGRGG